MVKLSKRMTLCRPLKHALMSMCRWRQPMIDGGSLKHFPSSGETPSRASKSMSTVCVENWESPARGL
jgi:hypothetical protein